MKKVVYIFLTVFILTAFFGCFENKGETVLAKAAGKKLTYSELSGRFDTTSIKSRERLNDAINHWINLSVLYEEAKNDITGSGEYKMMLENAKQDIAVNLLLKQEIYSKEVHINENEIINYYNSHLAEYFLSSDIVNISYAVFINESIAAKFLTTISEKNKWITEVQSFIKSHAREVVVSYEDSVFFKRSELYPPDVWKVATALRVLEVSKPVRTFDGYMVVKLNSYQRAGEIGSKIYAREDIIERLTVEKKKDLYMKYLNSLRTKYGTENYFEVSINE